MRIFRPVVSRSVISAACFFALPMMVFAAGGTAAPSPAMPKAQPVRSVKVWTNEDVEALGPRFATPAPAAAPAQAAAPATRAAMSVAAPALPPEQDPRWYSQQLEALESELADVSAQEEALQNFRATSKGLPTGLNVAAPCQGVGTDNLIAQLDARRQEIEQQIDTLGDSARTKGLPPGILVEGRGLVSPEAPLTQEQQRAALLEAYSDLSDQLAESQDTVAAMNSDAASRRITLSQPNARWGGNLTANMQQSLYNQQSELQSQISAIQDQAQTLGVTTE